MFPSTKCQKEKWNKFDGFFAKSLLWEAFEQYFVVGLMSSQKLYFRVPFDKGHAHFYDTIQSFPGLHAGPSFEDREKYLRDTIRHQLLSTTPEQAKRIVTLRECFRLNDRSHVEFCLEKKLPGTSLRQAAEELGLRK